MSDKTYLVTVCYGEKCVRKRVKSDSMDAELVGVIGIAVDIGGKLKNTLVLGKIGFEDFKVLAEKYGVNIDEIRGYIAEIREEKKSERELGFGRN